MLTPPAKISVLFLGSSPKDVPELELTREFNELTRELRRQHPERFELQSRWGESATSLPDLLDEYQPQILHFSGHGEQSGALLFEDQSGLAYAPDPAAVAKVFEQANGKVCCVVLNACFSKEQALRIAEHVDVVIGLSDQIEETDAREFAKAFYKALGEGRSVGAAFQRAKLKLELGGAPGQHAFEMLSRPSIRPEAIFPHPSTREPPDYVFVAHMPRDKLQVLGLCRALIANGVRPWFDMWDLAPRGDWRADMQSALVTAPAVLVCEGPAGSAADNSEYGSALRKRLARDPKTVYRARLPTAPKQGSSLVEQLAGVDLDAADWSEGVAELAMLIGIDDEPRRWQAYEARLATGELSPYQGLAAFGERAARWMFGRDQEIGELLTLVETSQTRFLTVIGASGSGKSSLVLAGLCPSLRNGALGDGRAWKLAYLRPGRQPCEALAGAVLDLRLASGASADALRDADDLRAIHAQLLEGTDVLRLVLSRMSAAEHESATTNKIVLVVDQLEELFTEAQQGQTESGAREVEAFIANLVEATTALESFWVVATLRADFMQRSLELGSLARALKAGTYFALPPMSAEQIRAAIEMPARRLGFEVEPGLADELVVAAADHAGRLPLLQHVLRELWVRRDETRRTLTRTAYLEVGGLEGAIAAAADRAMTRLTEALGETARALTRRVMTRLVHLGKGVSGDTRRRATLAELGDDEQTRKVLDAFVRQERVLVASEVNGVEVFEIAHEALLREWSTLVDWLDKDREALALRQELARDAGELEASSGNSEYLWGKGRVAEARRVLDASTVELNAAERRFLEASEAAVQAQEAAKRRRRRRLREAVAAAFMVLVGVAGVVSVLAVENKRQSEAFAEQAKKNRKQAEDNLRLAESERMQRERTNDALLGQLGLHASMLANDRRTGEALLTAIEAAGRPGPDGSRPSLNPNARGGFIDVVVLNGIVGEVGIFEGHSGPVNEIAFSPDGTRLASTGWDDTVRVWDVPSGNLLHTLVCDDCSLVKNAFAPDGSLLATSGQTARLWEVASGKPRALEGHSGNVIDVTFSPDGSRLASASEDHGARVWDVASGELLHAWVPPEIPLGVVFLPDGTRLATFSKLGTLRVSDIASDDPVHRTPLEIPYEFQPWLFALSPDGTRLATIVEHREYTLWDVASGKPLHTLEDNPQGTPIVFSADGSRVATAEGVWDVASGKRLATIEGSYGSPSLTFSPDGARFATIGDDNTAQVWDVASGELLANLDGVRDVAFSPDGTRLATAGYTTRLWSIGKLWSLLEGHSERVTAFAFSPDSTHFATASDNAARVWDVTSGKSLHLFEGHSEPVWDVAFSPNGILLATASEDDTAGVWDVASGEPLILFEGHSSDVTGVAFSPNSTVLATASNDGTARMWNIASGESLHTLGGHSQALHNVAFSPDGIHLATASYHSVRVWNAASGTLLFAVEDDYFAFSPDGTRLATSGDDGSVRVWNVASGEILANLHGMTNVAFSPDGTRVATVWEDASVHLWDVASGKSLATFVGHSNSVADAAFSPDGTHLASAGWDDSVYLWNLASGKRWRTFKWFDPEVWSAELLGFSPNGTWLATNCNSTVILWPMPELALELACELAHDYVGYGRVAEVCDPILSSRSRLHGTGRP